MAKKSSKKKTAQKYAPIALWVSLAALLSTGIFGIVKLLVFLELLTLPNRKVADWGLLISAGLILIGIAVFILMNPRGFINFFTGRQGRYGSNAVIMLLAFLTILVVTNLWAYNSTKEWDLTEDRQFTLAPETVATLEALPEPVMAYAFYTNPTESLDQLLSDLKGNSNGQFDYEVVNPDTEPGMAQQYEVTRDATLILVMGEQREAVTYADETSIVNALYRLMNPGQRTVYFLTGHGEQDINGSGTGGYSSLRTILESKNYTVRTLNLLAENRIPDDATLIVIAGPLQPISANEATLIADYLAGGGSLIVLSESPFMTQTLGATDPLADYLASEWGITLSNDIVIDTTAQDPLIAVSAIHASHPITEALQTTVTFYPTSRSLLVAGGSSEDISTTVLVTTAQQSWGETDIDSFSVGEVEYTSGSDTLGPLNIAVAAQNMSTEARLVVIGDSEFASDTFFDQYGNGDMIINAIDWAAQVENMVTLTAAADPIERTLKPTTQTVVLLLGAAFICIIPLLIIVGGVASWLVRRSQG